MAERPILITIKGLVPEKIICPFCNTENIIPPKPEGPRPMYFILIECNCGKSISLRCLTHGH